MRIWREPILHFLALGALVFAAYRALRPDPTAEREIAVDARKRSELAALFELRQHRKPNPRELDTLVERWIEDEVLFREGVALGLTQQDGAIRALMVAQMRALLQRSIELPRPGRTQLERFFAEHRADYAAPERISFSEYLIPAGAQAADQARELLQTLAAGQPVERAATEHRLRSEAQLLQLHDELGRRIFALEPGKWHQLRSARGLHVVRVEAREAARQYRFDELASQLPSDWQAAEQRRRFDAELARLRSRYDVRLAARAEAGGTRLAGDVP